jgi:hypothetical protein
VLLRRVGDISSAPRYHHIVRSPTDSSLSLAAVLAHATSRLSAINVHRRLLLLLRLLGVDDALLDVASQAEEGLFDVDVGFCAHFHERNAELVGERLALLGGNCTLLFPVALVADQDLVHALGCMLLNVGEPGTDVCR